MKICNKCGIEKELTEYSKHNASKDGYRHKCIECHKPDIKTKICIKCNLKKDIIAFTSRKDCSTYRTECKDCKSSYIKEWRKENTEHIKSKRKENYLLNKDIINEKCKEYYSNNKESVIKGVLLRTKKRMKTDTQFNLTRKVRAMITDSFRNHGFSKSSNTAKILGCSFEDFKLYLENKFELKKGIKQQVNN